MVIAILEVVEINWLIGMHMYAGQTDTVLADLDKFCHEAELMRTSPEKCAC